MPAYVQDNYVIPRYTNTTSAFQAVSFSGTVANIVAVENNAITPVDLSTFFSGSETPFTYAVQSGTLPTGLSLNPATGILSGTPTAVGLVNIVVRATDQAANTADTNSFSIDVQSSAVVTISSAALAPNDSTMAGTINIVTASAITVTGALQAQSSTMAGTINLSGLATSVTGALQAQASSMFGTINVFNADTTTGTTSFDLEFVEIAEEAWERVGRQMRSGYDLRTARRSMNLMQIEWQNRGINMWSIDSGTIPLLFNQGSYTLPADTIDLLEHVVRTGINQGQSDLNMERISVSEYSSLTNKNQMGRPTQLWIQRLRNAPVAHVWPLPSSNDYTLVYWRMRRLQDAGAGIETSDIVFRFYPVLVAGLAYYIAMKVPELSSRMPMLKAEYEEQFRLASSEDREKASWFIRPGRRYY